MALDGGTSGFPTGTGTKSLNMGVTMTGMTWLKVYFQAPGYKRFRGMSYAGTSYQYCYSDPDGTITTGKFFQLKNSAGTIVLEGTFTGFSGTNANFNITTGLPGTLNGFLFEWGN